MFKLVCICMLACMIPLCAPGKSIGEALEKMSPAHPRLFTGNGGLERLKANAATPDGRALAGRALHDAEEQTVYQPQAETADAYEEAYAAYRRVYEALYLQKG